MYIYIDGCMCIGIWILGIDTVITGLLPISIPIPIFFFHEMFDFRIISEIHNFFFFFFLVIMCIIKNRTETFGK